MPITLALYYLAPAKLKNTVLFLCSLVFYCWGEVRFFPVMVALILINYLSGLPSNILMQSPRCAAFFLLVALVGSLGMLFYFKYANFVLRSVNALLGTAFAEIQGIGTLPLGISFYTFQTLSYSIDVYRRDVKAERNIIDFGAYVVMFPQLIAGPIVKYRDVSDQLHVYKHRYNLKQIEEGMTLFTFGLAKKVLLADAVGALWTDIIGVADSPSTTFVGLANASPPAGGGAPPPSGCSSTLLGSPPPRRGGGKGGDAGLRLPRKLQLPLYLRLHHRVLAALAHDPVRLVPGVCVYPAGRQPQGAQAADLEPVHRGAAHRHLARRELELYLLGSLLLCAAGG